MPSAESPGTKRIAANDISLGVFVVMWRLCTDLHWCHWSRRWRMPSARSIPRRSSSSRTSVTSRRRASCQQASTSYFEVPTREALWFGGHIGSTVAVELNHRSMSVHIGFHPMYCVSGAHLPHMCILSMLSLSLSHMSDSTRKSDLRRSSLWAQSPAQHSFGRPAEYHRR